MKLIVNSWIIREELSWTLVAVACSAFVSLFFSWQLGVFLLFFIALAWWVWENPEEGFLLLIVIAPLLLMLKITQTISTVTLLKDVIIITLFAKLFFFPLLTKKLSYRQNILIVPIIVLWCWALVSAVRADNLVLGVLRVRDIVLYSMLYFGVLYLPHNHAVLKRRWQWFMAGLTGLVLLGGYQWFWAMDSTVLRYDPVREVWIPRISSVMAHPSIFGQYLVAAVFLGGASFFYTRRRNRGGLGVLMLVSLLSVFLTYSRAVWLGLLAGGGLMFVLLVQRIAAEKIGRRRLTKILLFSGAGGLLLMASVLTLTPAGTYLKSVADPTYGSNEERIDFLVRLIAPLTNKEAMVGKGLGDVLAQNFRETDLTTYDIASGEARAVQLTKNRTLVDNQYLKTFVEMGLAGTLIYLWIYWVFLKTAWQKTGSADSQQRVIAWWGLGFVAAFVVQAAFIDIWDIWPTNAMFWVVAAMVSNGKIEEEVKS